MRVTRRNQPSVWTFQSNWNTSHTHTQHFGAAFKYSPKSSPIRISSYLPTNASLILDTKVKTHSLTWSCWSPLHSTWLEADPGGKITLFNAYYIDLLRNSCNLDGIEMNSGNTPPKPWSAGCWPVASLRLVTEAYRQHLHLGDSKHPHPSARRTLC